MNLDPLINDDDPAYHWCPFCAATTEQPHEPWCPYSSPADEAAWEEDE